MTSSGRALAVAIALVVAFAMAGFAAVAVHYGSPTSRRLAGAVAARPAPPHSSIAIASPLQHASRSGGHHRHPRKPMHGHKSGHGRHHRQGPPASTQPFTVAAAPASATRSQKPAHAHHGGMPQPTEQGAAPAKDRPQPSPTSSPTPETSPAASPSPSPTCVKEHGNGHGKGCPPDKEDD